MEGEVTRLREELAREKAAREALEEECDELAMANVQLEKELLALKTAAATASASSSSLPPAPVRPSPLVAFDGDGRFANKALLRIENACGGMNVLCVSFCWSGGARGELLACGGTDNSVSIYDPKDGALVSRFALSAPVLCLDSHASLLAASLMDGSAVVIDLSASATTAAAPAPAPAPAGAVVATLRQHGKYVVAVRWSPDGRFLATASYDKSVLLYRCRRAVAAAPDSASESGTVSGSGSGSSGGLVLHRVSAIRLASSPEAIAFVPAAGADAEGCAWDLVIAARETSSLVYIRCPEAGPDAEAEAEAEAASEADTSKVTGADTEPAELSSSSSSALSSALLVPLNEQAWDTHVSFAPLALARSPDGQSLLVATDKHFHYLSRLRQSQRERVYAGHACGEYGKPRVAFDAKGQYLYCTSEGEGALLVYDVASAAVVGRLAGHGNVAKDVCCSSAGSGGGGKAGAGLVASGGFDRAVIVWGYQPEEQER